VAPSPTRNAKSVTALRQTALRAHAPPLTVLLPAPRNNAIPSVKAQLVEPTVSAQNAPLVLELHSASQKFSHAFRPSVIAEAAPQLPVPALIMNAQPLASTQHALVRTVL